ncbi:unnamed protein product, partial [Amoebophrya sp. A25]|eukprot:GSA25T00014972001.1
MGRGLDIENAGSARDTPSDQDSPVDECGGSPGGKDAEAQALLRRQYASRKEQRDGAGKKNRLRGICDRPCRVPSRCLVCTVTTIAFLFSVGFYFYLFYDAALAFLEKTSRLAGQVFLHAQLPSSTLQTSQAQVADCGSVTCCTRATEQAPRTQGADEASSTASAAGASAASGSAATSGPAGASPSEQPAVANPITE